MKKLLLTTFAAAVLLQVKAQTYSHVTVPVTGFTADVIADGAGSAAISTTADVDGGNYNLMAQNFVNPSNQSPTSYLPGTGLITSAVATTPGLTFQLAPYTGNNSLRLTTTTSSGTLTFTTPRSADKVNLLVTSAYSATFTATVNFTDGTNQVFVGNTVPNWFDGANPAIQGIGRVLRTTNAIENSTTNPRMYQFALSLSPGNTSKMIQNVAIAKTSVNTNEILHIFAVTASTVLPNDIGITAITAPTSPVAPNVSLPVTVTVKNFGSSPLTTATLGFSVNGTTVVNNFAFNASPALAMNATSAPVAIGNFPFPAGIHKVKAWTKLPNGVADGAAFNDSVEISLVSCTNLNGNYTINKNSIGSPTNFTSFATAVQALTSCGVSGPVTFTVSPNSGPYNEQVTLPVISGTSTTNTVTFEGNGNTLTASTTAAKQGVIIFNGADFVKVNNLKINVSATAPAGWGVQLINASDNNIISNCTINIPITSSSDQFNGIVTGTSTSSVGNFANSLLVQNNIINGGYYGVLLNGSASISNNRVIGNQIRDPHVYGIFLNSSGTGTIVEGNDISRPTRIIGTAMYGVYMTGATSNATISKNRIHNTHDVAANTSGSVWAIYTSAAPTAGNENIIKNNLFYNVNNFGGIYYAFYNQDGSGTYYYHNTVSGNNTASLSYLRGIHFAGTPTNVKFVNNLVSLPGPATNKHAIYVVNTSTLPVSNNNVLHIGSSGNVGFYATDKPTLADWKLANGGFFDQNSISADPVFANTSSHLQPLSAAVNNGGQPLAAVTDDITGIIRSTTTPDMGAYEFTPVANDAGIVAINAPASPVVPGNQPVQVTLRNFGTANLTSATIGWSVNGVSQPNYTWAGSLNTFQSTAAPVNIGNYTFSAGNYTIKVWSKMPNGTVDPIVANDTTILKIVSCSPLAGNYIINKNNPTAGTNFQSILEAAQKLGSCGIAGPVTFTLAANSGPYNEQVEFTAIPGASTTNTITFEGSGNTVSVTPVGKPGVFILNGAKYVKLNNFIITVPASATSGWGVQLINAADDNIISNNTINLPLAATAMDVNGIVSGTTPTNAGNHTNNSRFQNNIINGGYHGIRLNGVAGGLNATNNQITNNQFKDNYGYGVYLGNTSGTLVERNDISRPLRTNTSSVFYGIYLGGTGSNGNITSKNRIHNTHDAMTTTNGTVYGIQVNAPATIGNENIVKNNLIYNLNNTNGTVHGLSNSAGNSAYYYFNTVATDPARTYNALRGMSFTTAVSNVKFVNNIISMPSQATTNKHAIYVANAGISLISNNNDFFVGSAGHIGYFAIDKPTLADWKATNSNAYDQNSVATDPLFVSLTTGNLQPSSVSADNLGQPLTTVTEDILGITRHVTTPDFGAFEFGAASTDVSIVNVSGPALGSCSYSATDSVTITIKNLGAVIQTSIPVTYSVNGVSIAAPETFTGSIAPNATATYTFNTKVNLATPGTYNIIARTLLTGDVNVSNNADSLSLTNAQISGMPVVLDFETVTTGISSMRKVINAKSVISEGTGASNGAGSTKGMIMDGVDHTGWVPPAGITDPWASNPNNFAGAYFCFSPGTGASTDSLIMTFDLKQLFKTANANTNFRVTVNGTQAGPTYRPPFTGTPIAWQKIRVDLTPHINDPFVQIGLESSVKEAYASGAGTANLIDNIEIKRVAVQPQTGVKDATLAAKLNVFPNPSNGQFNVDLPKGKSFALTVTDLSGKVIRTQTTSGEKNELDITGFAKGIYLLKIQNAAESVVRKLVIE